MAIMSVYGLMFYVNMHAKMQSAHGLYPLPYPSLELWMIVSCVGCWVTVSGHKRGGVQHRNLHRYVLCLKQCRIVRTGEMPPAMNNSTCLLMLLQSKQLNFACTWVANIVSDDAKRRCSKALRPTNREWWALCICTQSMSSTNHQPSKQIAEN